MGVHDGHRERLKERFIEHGLTSFNELNALEMLLFYAIPRKDTNPIAHALLDRFGSLNAVFDASVRELCEVEGIGQNAAVQARLYRAKSLVDGCVTIALLSVAIAPDSKISVWLDFFGSIIVAAYLIWCGVRTIWENGKKE